MFYLELFRALEREKVRYLAAGSMAAHLHGSEWMSMDIDLTLSMMRENLERFRRAGARLQLRSLGRSGRPTRLQSPAIGDPRVNIVRTSQAAFERAYARRTQFALEEVTLNIAAKEDLDDQAFAYRLSDEQLLHYSKLPALAKLTWLDQARRFTLLARRRSARRAKPLSRIKRR